MNAVRTIVGGWTRALQWASVIGAATVIAACGGGGGGTMQSQGSLRVALTDAPSCGYDHVYVTVEKVRVHQSATADDAEGGWSEIILSPARRIDLLSLTNGVLEELGTTSLSSGRYSQIRLVLASNTGSGASSLANAVQPTGGALVPLQTPSGQQSGLKLQAHFEVAAGQTADLLLDFDACKSVVKSGNSGKYNLKPVLSVVPRVNNGIQGYVSTSLSLNSTTVSVQQDGAIVRSTTPDSTGKFSIPYLSTGTYTLVVVSDGRANAAVTGVPVGTSTTVVSGTATAITPPASSMADASGAVTVTTTSGGGTTTAAVTEGTALALQSFAGGPVIQVGSQPIDADLGIYRFRLAVAAPVKAPYVSGAAFVFAPDAAAAGKYTIRMASPGRVTQDRTVDISTGSTTANFSYGP